MSNETTATGGKQFTREEIRRELESFSVSPFQGVLAKFLSCEPDEDSITAQAKRYPDRWVQAMQMLRKMSGYPEKLEVNATVHNLNSLSDADLERRVRELEAANKDVDGEAKKKGGK
jgi:hypothetical protein